MIRYHQDEGVEFAEYVEFLKRTDLGSQYPKERFEERLTKTLANQSLSFSARNEKGLLVGMAFGLTDFAYFLFLTDLGVDREYERQGIGQELIQRMHDAAGGEDDIYLVTVSADEAAGFYEKIGFATKPELLRKPCKVWTEFTVE